MSSRYTRHIGVITTIAGLSLAISAFPPAWYGVPPLDSYVFEPAIGSPLWIQRIVMPTLSVLGVLGLLLGLVGLLRRDWSVAGRIRRWSGTVATVGLLGLTVSTPMIATASGGGETLAAIVGILLGAGSVLVLVPALVFLGVGYLRTPRPHLGYALGGVVVIFPLIVALAPDEMGTFGASLAVAVVAAIVGHDLYHHADPLSERSPADRD